MAFCRFIVLAVAPFVVLPGCSAPPPEAPKHVVLISIDTLRRDALRAYSAQAPPSPEFEALAARSLIFDNALATSPWTLPSHASLMTGLYPDRHGAVFRFQGRPMTSSVSTLAEILQSRGYRTVAFTDGAYLAPVYGFARGFDRYDAEVGDDALPPRGGAPNDPVGVDLFDRGIAELEQTAPETPLFLFLHSYAVHDYFKANSWARGAIGPGEFSGPAIECLLAKRHCPDTDWERLRALYRAEVQHMGRGIGLVLDALERTGRADDTFVILLSDHGEGFEPERGRIFHGGRLEEDQLRIPLWVRGPGVAAGRTARLASLVDVLPTILEALALPIPPDLDGESVLRPGVQRRPVLAMEHAQFWQDGRWIRTPRPPDQPFSVSVIDERYWYIQSPVAEVVYDMDRDPGQHQPAPADGFDHLRAAADLSGRPAASGSLGKIDPKVAPYLHQLDPALVQKLRALGYLD